MPYLNFDLHSPHLTFSGQAKSDEWRLVLSGVCRPMAGFSTTFTIRKGNKIYDGFNAGLRLYIDQRQPRTEVEGTPSKQPFDPNDKNRDIVHVTCPELEADKPYFEVSIWLPPDAYRKVIDMDWSKSDLALTVENAVMGQALVYGPDPDGREIEWDVDKGNYVFLEEAKLHFFPRQKGEVEINEKELREHGRRLELSAGVEDDLVNAIDRLTNSFGELKVGMVKAAWLVTSVIVVSHLLK